MPEAIAGLVNLQRLYLGNTQISELTPLAGLVNLQFLYLNSTQISDLAPLAGLVNLQFLDLDNTQISDLAPLAGLVNLQTLTLNNTQISDLAHIAGLVNLQTLRLNNTQISDLAPLAGLVNLQRLDLNNTQISDLAPLAGLVNLQTLTLNNTQISNLAPLAGLVNLQTLTLSNTQISDLAHIAGLVNLQTLTLSNTQISDLAHIAGLVNLQDLTLNNTQISDLAHIAGLVNLQTLYLNNTQISDLAPLRNLQNLHDVFFSSTPVADLRPLLSCPALATHDTREIQFMRTEATRRDPELARLAEIEKYVERTDQTLAYLRTLTEWPAPLGWTSPSNEPPDTPPRQPDQDQIPRLDVTDTGVELQDSPIDERDLSDPIKRRLYPKLQDAVRTLNRHANQYPEVTGPVVSLLKLTETDFEQADLLDIHLELAALTDLREADATRANVEKLDADCLTALNAVLRVGPGVTIGHPDVDILEARLAEYARQHHAATVAEGERLVAGGIAEQTALAGEKLRKQSGTVAKAGDTGRVAEYRRSLTRNTILALAAVADGIGAAATGQVYGSITISAAQFLIAHADAIMATAPAWGETGAKWLEYMLMRAQDVISKARRSEDSSDQDDE